MKLFQRGNRKLGNKGLSMVELICAVAIVSLLGTTVSSVLIVSANSYKRGSAEADVQQEAQLVTNQIGDLIIDATSEVASTANSLTITQLDGTVYDLTYDSATKRLNYQETSSGGVASEVQPLADGVQNFSVNTSKFKSNGNIYLNMNLASGDSSYPAIFTITSRNAVCEGTTLQNSTVATLVKKWLLEPNQEKDFSSFATSADGGVLSWSVENASDPNTVVSGATLKVGAAETSPKLILKATNASGQSASITVYIRRVTGISVTGRTSSVTPYAGGTVYDLVSVYTGSTLNQITGASYDTDYISPRTVEYSVSNTDAARIVGNTVELKRELNYGEKVIVTAKALHPAGKNALNVNTNKTGQFYGSVVDTFVIERRINPLIPGDDGWKRLSDAPQATVDSSQLSALIQSLKDSGAMDTDARTAHKYTVRYKAKGESTFTEVTDPDLIGGADGANSSTINIRPLISGSMEYGKDYIIEITWILYEVGNPTHIYHTETLQQEVMKVGAQFKSNYYGSGAPLDKWSESSRIVIDATSGSNLLELEETTVTGISLLTVKADGSVEKNDRITNELNFILEKKNASGGWDVVTGKVENKQGKCQIMQSLDNGDYRVKVEAELPNVVLEDGAIKKDGTVDFKFYTDGSDSGVYYFTQKAGTSGAGEGYEYTLKKTNSYTDWSSGKLVQQYKLEIKNTKGTAVNSLPITFDYEGEINSIPWSGDFAFDNDSHVLTYSFSANPNETKTIDVSLFVEDGFKLK